MKSPFKFLDSYTLEDRNIFFGRDQEITDLYRRVFESKMLLVYGVSGTGKSSLINCGLASRFDDSDWLPVNVRRGSNIIESLNDAFNKQAISPLRKNISVSEKLQSIYLDHFKPVYLIFDQFEELFIFGSQEEKTEFRKLIKEVIKSETQCRVLFIIREEFLAGITEFEYDLPEIFSNRFRVEKMKRANAISAIEGPCKVHKIDTEPGFSEELIDKLCPAGNDIELTFLQIYLDRILRLASDELQVSQEGTDLSTVHPPSFGHRSLGEGDRGDQGGLIFTTNLLSLAGNVSDLLGQFLEEQIKELDDPDNGMSILKSFVSVQGTKRQMNESEILVSIGAFGTVIAEQDLLKYLTKFVDLRILRERNETGHFELRHDAIAAKIFEKFTAIEKDIIEVRQFIDNALSVYEKRGKLLTAEDLKYIAPYEDKLYLSRQTEGFIHKSKSEIIRSRKSKRTFAMITAIALIILLSGFTIWALNERKTALKERETANQNYLKARANSYNFLSQKVAETDPTTALRLAEYALSIDTGNPVIFQNLNRIYYDNNFYRIVSRHEDGITSVAYSPDGNSILTGSFDKTIRLWDLQGKLLQVFKGHEDTINSVAFSPDGKRILTGSSDFTARLWDLNGNTLQVFNGHSNKIRTVAFSPDGKTILTGSFDNTARLWDIQGRVLQVLTVPGSAITSVAFSPDGKTLLTGSGEKLWFSESYDRTARLWDLKGHILKIFKGHEDEIYSVVFSPDGKSILTGSYDNTARLWDLHGNMLKVFKGHEGAIISVAFSPDGKNILTGSGDKTARIWDLQGTVLQVFKGYEREIRSVAYSPDGKSILTGSSDKTVRLWKFHENIRQVFKGHELQVSSSKFSPDGKSILTGSYDKTARLTDLGGNLLQVFKGHNDRIYTVSFAPDGKSILTGSQDNTACLWDLQGKIIQVFNGSNSWIYSAVFSPDGKSILTGSADSRARLWDLKGNILQVFNGHTRLIWAVAFSPDGKSILTGSNDNTAIRWDLQGNVLQVFKGHGESEGISSLAFSPDGKRILTGSYDNTARLWDLQGNVLKVYNGNEGAVFSVAFSPDGKNILTGSHDGIARIWDLQGNSLEAFRGHERNVSAVAFSPDGKSILTGSWDKTSRLWNIRETLKEFQKENACQDLSIAQRTKYGILKFSDILKLDDEKSTYEAAEYYYSEIYSVGNERKSEYINNALKLYEKLVAKYNNTRYIRLLDIYELLKGIKPDEEIEKRIENLTNELLSAKDPDDIMQGARYFYFRGQAFTDWNTRVSYYKKSIYMWEKSIIVSPYKYIKRHASGAYDALSYGLLMTHQFEEALKSAQRGAELYNNAGMNSKLALGYLFNGKYDQAYEIIERNKDSKVMTMNFKDYILSKLEELEKEGITTADSKRLKEVLKK
jgi:WD40 repeat protein